MCWSSSVIVCYCSMKELPVVYFISVMSNGQSSSVDHLVSVPSGTIESRGIQGTIESRGIHTSCVSLSEELLSIIYYA